MPSIVSRPIPMMEGDKATALWNHHIEERIIQ
jgi:hypothetical protein